jgi:hypothetical protein
VYSVSLVDALGQSGDEVGEEGVPQPRLVQVGGVPGIRQLLRTHMNVWTYIQRQDSKLALSVILSVDGADPIAEVKLSISPFFCADLWIMKSIMGFLNNSNLHAITSTSLIINLS